MFEIANGGASIYSGLNQNLFGSNVSWSGSTASYKATSFASFYNQQNGQHQWTTAPSGTAGTAITFTTAMTLNASGILGLGVVPSAWGSLSNAIQLKHRTSLFSYSSGLGGVMNNIYSVPGTADYYIATDFASRYYQFQGAHIFETAPSGTANAAATLTER